MIDGFDPAGLQPRAAGLLPRALDDASKDVMDGFMFQATTSSASDNEMSFTSEHSRRTAFIALASINVVAAAATAVGIFFDCYLRARRRDAAFNLKSSLLTIIGPKETLPYILSLGIVVQGIIFAVAQSVGLEANLTLGCTQTSQMMLPALFIVPYIQLVFGSETTIRALAPQPFRRSPKWALPACLGLVGAALLVTFVITLVTVAPNFCFAELLWLVQRWALGTFGVLTMIASVTLIGSLVIFIRLYKSSGITEAQRTMASWTACFQLLASATTVMLLPFFWSLHADMGKIMRYQSRLSMVATIVINMSGLLTGGLYVLLRCTKLGKLGHGGYSEFDDQEVAAKDRSSTPGNSIYTKQLEQPISPVRLEQMRSEKMSAWPMASTARVVRPQAPKISAPIPHIASPELVSPAGALVVEAAGVREKSYRLFPSRQGAPDPNFIPAVAQHIGALPSHDLLLPKAAWTANEGDRASVESTTTVQIALRVSNINDMPPVTPSYFVGGAARTHSPLGLAIAPDPFSDENSGYDEVTPQSPLPSAADEATSDDEMTLSPTVYSPGSPGAKIVAGPKARKFVSGQWI